MMSRDIWGDGKRSSEPSPPLLTCNSNGALVTVVLVSMRCHGIITQDKMSSLFWGRMAGTRDLNPRILGGYGTFIGG